MQRTLGQRITFYRERLSLSQKELAQKLNIGKSTMSQYESDERRPSDEIKLQLCEIFSISLDELMGRINNPQKKTGIKIPVLGRVVAGKATV